jgi:uncharacterized LabA/DUF88 family protein
LDWRRFRIFLRETYEVDRVYLFIGYIPTNQKLYSFLQNAGYELIFKPVLFLKNNETKWNVDAELVLQSMIDIQEYKWAIIVSGDGDFACLVNHLYKASKLRSLIVPNEKRFSQFLKQSAREKIDGMQNLRHKLEFREQ